MRSFEQYDKAPKHFAKGVQRDNSANEVQSQLQLYDLSVGEYLNNKYALWLDFRTIDENSLHRMGRIEMHRKESLYRSRRKQKWLGLSMLTST